MNSCLDILVCPQCKSKLQVTDKGLYCARHKKYYPLDGNIIKMNSVDQSFFILSREEELKLIENANHARSLEELKSIVYNNYNPLYTYIFQRKRSDFLYLLSCITRSGVNVFLDVGAGFGNVAAHI